MNGREHFTTKKDIAGIENVIRKIREMNRSISFNEDEHRYFYKSKEMMSVSRRLEHMTGDVLALAGTDMMEMAVHRGNAVHKKTEEHDLGIKKIDITKEHEAIQPYLKGYLRFLANEEPIYIGVEQKIAVKSGLTCGTIDRIYIKKTKEGKLRIGILDIKTGSHRHKNVFQMHYYSQMLRMAIGTTTHIEKTLLYVDKVGNYKIRKVM